MSAPVEIPSVVARALDAARRRGYASFCRHETGRLLAALAASREGVVAEFGTGCGVGTAPDAAAGRVLVGAAAVWCRWSVRRQRSGKRERWSWHASKRWCR